MEFFFFASQGIGDQCEIFNLNHFCDHKNTVSITALLNCPSTECQEALGMENGVILDEKITASSQYAERTGPAQARLYIENTFGTGGWLPTLQDANPWLQIDLVSQYRVTRVATQGRYYDVLSIWVIKYKLAYSSEGEYLLKYYKEEGQTTEKVKIFMAIF